MAWHLQLTSTYSSPDASKSWYSTAGHLLHLFLLLQPSNNERQTSQGEERKKGFAAGQS